MSTSRPSFPLNLPRRARPELEPEQLRLAVSTLAISLLLFAAMVWLILAYL